MIIRLQQNVHHKSVIRLQQGPAPGPASAKCAPQVSDTASARTGFRTGFSDTASAKCAPQVKHSNKHDVKQLKRTSRQGLGAM